MSDWRAIEREYNRRMARAFDEEVFALFWMHQTPDHGDRIGDAVAQAVRWRWWRR